MARIPKVKKSPGQVACEREAEGDPAVRRWATAGDTVYVRGSDDLRQATGPHVPIPSVEGMLAQIAGRPYPLIDRDLKVALSGHYFPDLLDHATTVAARLAEVEEELADLKSARDDWQEVAREQGEALAKARDLLHGELNKGDDRREWSVAEEVLEIVVDVARELERS